MGYTMLSGRYAGTVDVVLAVGLAVSGATNGDPIELGDKGVVRLGLDVSALGAGTTLTVHIETSFDQSSWRSLGNFTAVNSAPASARQSFSGCDRYVRARFAFSGGTTTATVSLSGEAV